jgi:hypothetical protein
MPRHIALRSLATLFNLIFFFFLLIFLVGFPINIYGAETHNLVISNNNSYLPFAESIAYTVVLTNVEGTTEYRFNYNNHHFMTLVYSGTLNLRPHPGCDVNGWGSSWYAQPFLGSVLTHTVINTANANPEGIHVVASGKVSRGESSTYGTWGTTIDLKYDPIGKSITGTGKYTITLAGQLTDSTGDLNLYKIASNYLDDVRLITGEFGDTGDMEAADVVGDSFSFRWVPPNQPSHFPIDKTDSLSINVIGKYNNVDVVGVTPAFKPSLKVILTSQQPNVGMIFGGIYSLPYSQTFSADNVGITPLIQKTSNQTVFGFDIAFESRAIESCIFLPVIRKS